MTIPPSAQNERMQRAVRWLQIAFWIFVVGVSAIFWIAARFSWLPARNTGGLDFFAALIGAVLFSGPAVLLWFLIELFVWAIWLRLITKGLGIVAPFIYMWWLCLATGLNLEDAGPEITVSVLLICACVLGYVGIVRRATASIE